MRVLVLHPEDDLRHPSRHWDLVVDCGRAPAATYDRWRQQVQCEVFSLYRFAEEIEYLSRVRELLKLGTGRLVDPFGLDWWDLLALEIVSDLQQHMLVRRLANELDSKCELFSSRPNTLASALQMLLGVRLNILGSGLRLLSRRLHHYYNRFSQLDSRQLAQVLEDKCDADHSIRRRFRHRPSSSGQAVILLPSAYANVSRMAISYASRLPDQQFLLVTTRANAKLKVEQPNVRELSLTPYFVEINKREIADLIENWSGLRKHLIVSAKEFEYADRAGALERIPALIPWGVALRRAWSEVFKSENVVGCFSADDSNPPSSIPLIMAKQRGLPAIACHHGALDYQMAIKANHADFYLAKSEMEQDYLERICHLARRNILRMPPPAISEKGSTKFSHSTAPWMVFFTEPYQSHGWRSDEVYRDLLPRLCSLAQTCGLKLVFKLHPFESVKAHRRMLRRHLGSREREIKVVGGPPSNQLWQNIRFALTVQSSTALDCTRLGIPVFLCAWLQDPYAGYVQQYAKFGVGSVLESPEKIAEIPSLLRGQEERSRLLEPPAETEKVEEFNADYTLPLAGNY